LIAILHTSLSLLMVGGLASGGSRRTRNQEGCV